MISKSHKGNERGAAIAIESLPSGDSRNLIHESKVLNEVWSGGERTSVRR
jgi:hypothetical protein